MKRSCCVKQQLLLGVNEFRCRMHETKQNAVTSAFCPALRWSPNLRFGNDTYATAFQIFNLGNATAQAYGGTSSGSFGS